MAGVFEASRDQPRRGVRFSESIFRPSGPRAWRSWAPPAFGAVAQMVVSRIFPSSPRRGGRDINKISRSLLYGADGVVIKFHRILLRLNTTPSARAKDASRRF